MSIMGMIDQTMRAAEYGGRVMQAVGEALTHDQQMAVSPKIVDGPDAFIAWLKTDTGRTAMREFVDKFAASA